MKLGLTIGGARRFRALDAATGGEIVGAALESDQLVAFALPKS